MIRRLGLVALGALVAIAIGYALIGSGPKVPESSVLVVRLSGELEEAPAVDALQKLMARGPALPTLLLQLAKAAADDRIEAVLLHVGPLSVGYARIQELRDALGRVRDAGKPVIALLDLESFNATRELYLVSAASQVYVVPGFLGPLAGIAGQVLSLGGFFEMVGVEWQYERSGKYKSAPEMYTERQMSPEARQQAEELFDGIFGQIVKGIASGRGLAEKDVLSLIESAPATAEEIVRAGLADVIADREEVLALAGLDGAEEVESDVYVHVDPRDLGLRNGPEIALIFGDGTIVQGTGSRRRGIMGSDRIVDALQAAADDDAVRAIVLRINSPGGSPLASDRIWGVIREIRQQKPVVISMADYAASGGYYVACAADAIVAQPATVTGSIGVFLSRPSFQGLYQKLEINAELIARGPYASILGGDAPLTPEQRVRLRQLVSSVYSDFLDRVATGRDISVEEADRLGQGRIWLGGPAVENGLVDALGGLEVAVERAKREAAIDDDVDPMRVLFPGPRGVVRQIRDLMQGELRAWLTRELLPGQAPALLEAARLALNGGITYLPPYWVDF